MTARTTRPRPIIVASETDQIDLSAQFAGERRLGALPAPFTYGNSGGKCFNLTNTPSFNAPATAIDTATAGRVTSTLSTPRQFQFGLKFNF